MAQPETFLAFEDDDNGRRRIVAVDALEYLTQQSLSEFVNAQKERISADCVNCARGDCGLKGDVESGSREGDIPTGMGGDIPGIVKYVTVSTHCESENCPSPLPAQRLADSLAEFHRLAIDGSRVVSDETSREVREAKDKATSIVALARAAANKAILEPAERQAETLIADAKAQVEASIAGEKERAAEITDAAYAKQSAVRIRELARITKEVTASLPAIPGKLF